MIIQPLTRILKFECCSCNQYAPDEDRDGRNVELINQRSYIGVGLLTITFLLSICLSIYLSISIDLSITIAIYNCE